VRTPIALALLASASLATAGDVPPVTDPVVKKECGSCHMVFPPQFLPQRSWQKLVDGLADHFGQDASLPESQRAAVLAYHLAHAADTPGAPREARKFADSISAAETPLRITETGRWRNEHRKVKPERWASAAVKSKVNCLACHKDAERGVWDD
jgi:hypothetical protein